MILLLPNVVNKVALTLTSVSTLSSPYYLFELENNQTFEKYYFTAPDQSGYPESYNLFFVRVKTNPNPLNGEVNLVIGEEYSYHVYEQTNPANLDPANATGIVENGILRYEILENDREEYTNTNTTRAVYRK